MTPHPADLLAALLEALDAEAEMPHEVRAWLKAGFRDFIRGTELERALGLSVGPGQAHAHVRNLMFRARRDRLIREAAARLPGSLHGRAVTISRAIRTFGQGGADNLPEPVLHTIAVLIFEHGVHTPTSRAQVARILRGESLTSRLGLLTKS